MLYTLILQDHFAGQRERCSFWRGLTLVQAKRKARKLMRRGHTLYGGPTREQNWGAVAGLTGGSNAYRSVVIYAEQAAFWAPYKSRAVRRRQGWRD